MNNDQELPENQQKTNVAEQDRLIAEAMRNIKIYTESGNSEGLVQIKPPQLTRFQLPVEGDDQTDCQYLQACDIMDPTAVDRWNQSLHAEVDLITAMESELIGKRQTDEDTGEQYMLVPIEVNILINPDALTPDQYKGEIIGDNNYLQKLPENNYDNHDIQVPKLSLAFELFWTPEEAENNLDLPSQKEQFAKLEM